MKAILCRTFGSLDSLSMEEIESPAPKEDEILIKVSACGINFPDLLIIQDKYQFKPTLPFSPGGEVSGIVEAVGASIKSFKIGERVIALCGWGGLAEKLVAKENRVYKMPQAFDFISAACTLYAYGTSYHALKDRAMIKADETLLVLGASGGVGLAAVNLGKIMGARVIAAASTDEKLEVCRNSGADHLINYSKQNLRTEITSIAPEGVDVIYDAVGGSLSEMALRSMAWGGRYLVVGFASGEIPKFAANLALLKGCSIVGVFWGQFAAREYEWNLKNFDQINSWIKAGAIKPNIFKVYEHKNSMQALKDLKERKVIGKAVVKIV